MTASLVTGANRGIGLHLARLLRARGDEVIATCREPSPELLALGVEVERDIDVSDEGSVARLAARLEGRSLGLLINNAGIMEPDRLAMLDPQGIVRQFQVNALGPLRITSALLGNLREGSKVAMITSRMGSIGDNTSGGSYGYRMSKAALNIAAVSLAHDLRPRKIAVGIFHPGMVATDMTVRFGDPAKMQPADHTAALLLARIGELSLTRSGQFLHANGQPLPW